ncbi:MAG TPA: glycosyltransferase family 4 protein [Chloroflexota bacterium]|nr:glycosyltransferase family 4 protein [Chloroflexota bacterium]
MKVVIISKALVRGVYQRTLEEIVRLGDIELSVISPPSWKEGKTILSLERRFTQGYDLLVTPIVFNGHYHFYFYPRLSTLLAEIRPEVVYVDEEPYNVAAWQALHWAASNGAGRVFYTWQNIRRRLPPPFSVIEMINYRLANGAIAANTDARDILASKGFARPVWIIPPGLDPDLYFPGNGLPGPEFQVGYVGRLVPEKGVDLLIRACKSLELPWRLSIIGDGPEREALAEVARQYDAADRVTFRGPLASTDVPAVLRELNVLVLPSRTMANWREQFGRVLVEAMACGVPVVGSTCGEIPQVIGEAGLIFAEGNSERLAERLAELQRDPELRAKLARLGRDRVLQNFTIARIAEKTLEVFRSLSKS